MPADIGVPPVTVRTARQEDVPALVEIFSERVAPTDDSYWTARLAWRAEDPAERFFLVADHDGRCVGAITGQVREREFRATRTGSLFAVGVADGYRECGVGTLLFEALCGSFADVGVEVVRAMVPRDEGLVMAFLRSQGMRAGPFVQMEMRVQNATGGGAEPSP